MTMETATAQGRPSSSASRGRLRAKERPKEEAKVPKTSGATRRRTREPLRVVMRNWSVE